MEAFAHDTLPLGNGVFVIFSEFGGHHGCPGHHRLDTLLDEQHKEITNYYDLLHLNRLTAGSLLYTRALNCERNEKPSIVTDT